ncbi:low molecular weight protein arginine phosphatase [Paradesulfitobacterium ferrireducens]|uniref:low molecular weight protein arginine phosphatase n=1 Tax=Paradesulfitobacterium ferrireducens TaxID=2816476 RepID=UPI001A8ED085|nr:low molecular weight protein arginine phosphatase [Paradesulfitobacterium ferrireducens]
MKLLFVCTGNTCRSPMAAALAGQIFGADAEIGSAGTDAWEGSGASQEAMTVMQERELDLSVHRSRRVSREEVAAADWVLPMTKAHELRLKALFPEYEHKIVRLGEWSDHPRDVPDPWGGSVEEYRACASELEKLLGDFRRRLQQPGETDKP